MFAKDPHHIIAIGASAGGMEEINSFFDHTPLDGVSYVIVQHLSASFKSRMVELLSRHSKLVVAEAQNGMIVKSNQVYLIPNDKFMTIHGHTLYLMDKENIRGPHLTINTFFNSLAVDSGTKSIGVILSGLGADGTEGIKAIKKAGGMIIARNPDTSDYGSMPSHAIATGAVDFVLEPESMPAVIERYVKQEMPDFPDFKNTPSHLPAETMPQIAGFNLAEVVNETLVSELNYLVICIDENGNVVKSYGDTAKFLIQKIFTLNLTELLPQPLAVAFRALNNETVKMNERKTVNGIKIKSGQSFIRVNLSIIPLIAGNQKLRIVTFNEDKSENPMANSEILFNEEFYHDLYADSLEKELHEVKEQLKIAYEKLDAANENMQSVNEELLFANEELQSSNEEMQSVNEELNAINLDYQLKNKQLIELNDDLNNYFKSSVNSQIFINNDLLLMKFSPNTTKLINLLESDIGRPLSNISTNLKFETIIEDIKKVLDEGNTITKEIETKDNKWFQIITMPYVYQTTNKASGAIITFNDITELKKVQLQLDKNNKGLLRINSDLENFIHTTSHDLLAPLNNIEGSIAVINQIKESDPEIADLLSIIDLSIKKFRSLIRDISVIARIESNTVSTEEVDLNEIIDNIEWSLSDRIKSSGTVINRNLEVSHFVFSKKNLRSILFNLISNGIKYRSERTPVVHIQTKRENDATVLSVQDNGVGMDKKHLDKIFDKYARIRTDVEGQGVGLYLAKKIIDSTGGNVVVESEPGIGSKFIIYFNEDFGQH